MNSNDETPKKPKKKGVDLRPFSGRSWQDLHDIHPTPVRISSEYYKIESVRYVALDMLRRARMAANEPPIRSDEISLLCWILRCEDAKENVATEPYYVGKPLRWNFKLYAIRQSPLRRLGLIEQLPAAGLNLVRVTAEGRILIKTWLEYLEQAHRDLKYAITTQPPANAAKVNSYLSKYCFNWESLEL